MPSDRKEASTIETPAAESGNHHESPPAARSRRRRHPWGRVPHRRPGARQSDGHHQAHPQGAGPAGTCSSKWWNPWEGFLLRQARIGGRDGRILACTLDLVLGKLSSLTTTNGNGNSSNAPPPPPPLQVSGAAVSKAVLAVTGASRKQLHEAYRRTGDLGDAGAEYFATTQSKQRSLQHFFGVASTNKKNEPRRRLTVTAVHERMQALATVPPGKGSQGARHTLLTQLLRSCGDRDEFRFVVRTLLGNMRIGATVKTVLVALERAVRELDNNDNAETSKETGSRGAIGGQQQQQQLEAVFNLCPRIPDIALALLQGGVPGAVRSCGLTLGSPIQPMLANPASSFDQVREFLKEQDGGGSEDSEATFFPALMEYKYDGMRAQIHWDGGNKAGPTLKLFSRHLLECTDQFPEVADYLHQAKADGVESFILDAEIVAVASGEAAMGDTGSDGGSVRLLPFQDLSRKRGSKSSQDASGNVSIQIFTFDLLYLNGQSILDQPLWKRRNLMRAHFKEARGFAFACSVALPRYDEALVKRTLEKAFAEGAEGLMIKLTGEEYSPVSATRGTSTQLSSQRQRNFGYESGIRGKLWLKLKRDYVAGFADTIDVVPIGAWHGSGRKAQNGFLSPILLAVYDDDEGCFQSISRCMSFSDDMYRAINDFYMRGIAYPPGLAVAESGDATANDSDGLEKEQDDDDDVDDAESDSETTDDVGDKERVNIFSGRPPSATIDTNEKPPIFFQPLEVWEVSFSDMSLSRVHTAASSFLNDPDGRGVSLRFPRFKRRRPDKSVEQATTAAQIATLFSQQSKTHAERR